MRVWGERDYGITLLQHLKFELLEMEVVFWMPNVLQLLLRAFLVLLRLFLLD